MSEPSSHASSSRDGNPTDPLVGTQIGPFTVVRRLGEGGMGAVYLARQEKPARQVALKILRSAVASERMLRRFELETEMLGRLHHPGIAQIHHAGTFATAHGMQPYFAMEYVDGKPVDVYARLHALTLEQRLELGARICDAVQHAHQKGLVHRDLKPGNILVTAEGEPKILDFGVARALEADVQMTAHTEAGDLVGTLGYMSPEQVGGESDDLDTRSDVYALGVVLYELLTGQLPFPIERKLVHEAARIIREEEPRRLSTIDKIYRGDVETIVAKALEKEKNRRYQSASALAADLRHFLANEPIAARPAGAVYQLVKFARRHRLAFASLLAMASTLVVGAGVAVWQAVRARDAEQIAVAREQEARTQATRAEQAAAFAQSIFGGISPYVANGQDTKLLRLLLQQAEQRITGELRELPEVEAGIRTTLGGAYTSLGLYTEARTQIERAATLVAPMPKEHRAARELLAAQARLQLRLGNYEGGVAKCAELVERDRAVLGDDDRATILARDLYADALMRTHRLRDAEQEARAAMVAAQRVCGDSAPATLHTMRTLAVIAHYLRMDKEAEELARKVLDVNRRDLGVDSLETWEAAGTLSMILDDEHRAGEAEALAREALGHLTRLLGLDHPQTLNLRNNLAVCVRNQGRFDEAEAMFREVATVRARVLAEDHPDTLYAWANVADTLLEAGKLDAAEPIVVRVLEQRRKRLGVDDPQTLHSLQTQAALLRARGDNAGGAAILGEIADVVRRKSKPGEDALQIALYNCAAALQDADNHVRAEPLYREVIDANAKNGGKEFAFIAAAINGLAKCRDKQGDAAGSNELFEQALAMRRRLFRDGNREIGYTLMDYGQALTARADWPAAERVLREAVANADKTTPADPVTAQKTKALLGAALLGAGKLDEAESLLIAAEPVLAQADSVTPSFLQSVRLQLAALFDAREKAAPGKDYAARAASWRGKAAEVSAK